MSENASHFPIKSIRILKYLTAAAVLSSEKWDTLMELQRGQVQCQRERERESSRRMGRKKDGKELLVVATFWKGAGENDTDILPKTPTYSKDTDILPKALT